MRNNVILMTDSYKLTHWKQYPPGTQTIYSYMESRGGRFTEIPFFGLQYYLKEYLAGPVITKDAIDEAECLVNGHLGRNGEFNRPAWEYILRKYGGRLPLQIKSVKEGTILPQRCAQFVIRNTRKDDKLAWLTNYYETLLSKLWGPCVVAANGRDCKKEIIYWHKLTGSSLDMIDFRLHDFGYRGVFTEEQAGIAGLAHLLHFKGTDTLRAIIFGRDYYNEPMAGFSIPASEHSTQTSWGKDREIDAVRNMLIQYPTGPVASVADSYDVYNWFRYITGEVLRDQILARDGVLVGRPDSGIPHEVAPKCMEIWLDKFGCSYTPLSFRVFNPKVSMIQGDGIVGSPTIRAIYKEMHQQKMAAQNLSFGSGGGLTQKYDRDTNQNAIKCSAIEIDDVWHDVFKQPSTDSMKVSKKGLFSVYSNEQGILTTFHENERPELEDHLVTQFYEGDITDECTLAECRQRANADLV